MSEAERGEENCRFGETLDIFVALSPAMDRQSFSNLDPHLRFQVIIQGSMWNELANMGFTSIFRATFCKEFIIKFCFVC